MGPKPRGGFTLSRKDGNGTTTPIFSQSQAKEVPSPTTKNSRLKAKRKKIKAEAYFKG